VTPARSQSLTYDSLNRLTTASGAYGGLTFTYDGVGNRTTRIGPSGTDIYAYPATSNKLSTVTTGANVRTFSTLANGSVSDDTRDPSNDYAYTFNNAGRLAEAKLNGSAVGDYVYNALEQRVAKTAGGNTQQFVYDRAGHLIEEADGSGNAVREYIWLGDTPVAMVDHSGATPVLYYIHSDHLNRPQKITDAVGAIVWDGVFDPFGNVVSVTGTVTNPLRFSGQYADSETVLAQNWFRDYDSSVGRYTESDPIGLLGGADTYGYAGQNPVSEIDPRGQFFGDPAAWTKGLTRAAIAEGAGGGPEDPAADFVALLLLADALINSQGDVIRPPPPNNGQPGCPNECRKIVQDIYDAMNQVQARVEALATDPWNLYNLAYAVPNPSLPPRSGTWVGHLHQASGWQNRLRNLIDQARRNNCPIPKNAWYYASRGLPSQPRSK
jgi:RHS repeat-associated protein